MVLAAFVLSWSCVAANIILPNGDEPPMMKVVDKIETSKNNNKDSEKTKSVLRFEFPIILH
ncbi:MAG TPA: hypothetical protein VH500_13610, partial [Nitrososphaeraceae archaeon]